MKKFLLLICAFMLPSLLACTPAHTAEESIATPLRVIIKFADTTVRPADPGFVNALSRQAGALLFYLRPMSGGAHVFEVHGLRQASELQAVVRRLAQQPGVVYAEEDALRRVQ